MATQLNQVFRTSVLRQKTQSETPLRTSRRTPRFGVINATTSSSTISARKLIESGTVRSILPKDASSAINSEGFILLDVRPTWEREKARVAGSLHVPIFVEDTDNSPITLLKKWVHFGYIGLWTGQYLTTVNTEFLSQVDNAIPGKDTKLLVACGEGLRSMTAASKLHNGGYKNLGWLAGGGASQWCLLRWRLPLPPLALIGHGSATARVRCGFERELEGDVGRSRGEERERVQIF